MGNKKKSNSSSSLPEQQNSKTNDDDIFKSLFGAQAPESQGLLGLHLTTPIPKNTEQESNKKKKREKSNNLEEDYESDKTKRKKNADVSDNNNNEIIEKKKKKKKRKREVIEEVYEAKAYGVNNADVEKKKVGEKRKSKDDVEEFKVNKEEEGYDDEDKLLRTVFVGNLPLKVKKKVLLKEFSNFGDVESVRIRSVPIVDSKTPRKGAIMKGKINESVDSVHAYIVFKDEKSARASLSHNMAVVGGNHIRVDNACPPRKKLKADSAPVYDNKRTVFVGNLPFDVKDEEIYQLLCGIKQIESDIEGVRVIRDPNSSVGKGIAYVLFKTMEAANFIIKKRHLKLRDRDLRLYHAKADSTPSKKRNLPMMSADNSRGKRLAVTPHENHSDKNKTKNKPVLSYQGLKASKSIQKKETRKKEFSPANEAEVKQRKNKRPAVAARKAKALKGVGASRPTGLKRKPEGRTPDSFHRNKKARKLM